MNITDEGTFRELDHRSEDGVDVRLLWDSGTDGVAIAVEDLHSGETQWFEVDRAEALPAFQNPSAYAAGSGGVCVKRAGRWR